MRLWGPLPEVGASSSEQKSSTAEVDGSAVARYRCEQEGLRSIDGAWRSVAGVQSANAEVLNPTTLLVRLRGKYRDLAAEGDGRLRA